ncbi:hypothetical protein ARAM_005415 [Aspergillus rambellii]|uniref:Histone deacetylase domain-containing protein n=1 Tax=Aspergillus rambellii TaxID=308745 RepID=A0A0F8UJH5_9EURO|nr:hypothetical protein ARAM_005415 [Aspergillus rambellii]
MSAKKSPRSTAATPEHCAPTTPASIAADHFKREVDLHQSTDRQSQTLVIVHDACYGHRFSRPRASRAALNSIVERPERIRACVLGISVAYVRLARRHAGGQFAPHPDLNLHQLPIPPFQIRKTARTLAVGSPAVTHVHGSRWMEDLKTMCDAAESRLALNGKELVRPHSSDLYLCSESLNAFEGALGGVCEGIDAVFSPSSSTKRAFVCIRPPGHHCSSGYPSGFCWINNVHVGITYAAMTHGLTHAAILDFDLHHGDGSQDIAWQQNQTAATAPRNAASYKKTRIGYFSLHDINSYPCEMGEPEKVRNASVCIEKAHGQSIWNVHLEPWKSEREFWALYGAKYTVLIDRARAFLRMHTERLAGNPNGPPPQAAIFISAGFDASEWEGAGMQRHQVNVPTEFYAKFTADVVRLAEEEGLGVDGRVISVLEGGYSNRALTTGVLSHLSGLGDGTQQRSGSGTEAQINRLATEMTDRLGLSETTTPADNQQPGLEALYDREWWSLPLVEELEALVSPPPLPPVVKPREKAAPTYFAPTQSFAAKVVLLPSRDRKSTTSSQASLDLDTPPLPPLPPVTWAVAAHELSKILIPSDRQTTSYRPGDLNAEASRLRRERQTAAITDTAPTGPAATAVEDNKRKLRMRKPKTSLPSPPRAETPGRRSNRNSRRTTLDSPSALPNSTRSPSMLATRRKSASATPTTTGSSSSSTPEQDGSDQRPASQGSTSVRRKPNTSRAATPRRTASPRKTPPVPQVPSAFIPVPPSGEEEEEEEEQPTTGSTPGDNDRQGRPDMDSLVARVGKLSIKLKVPSPEENAAREKKAAEERKRRPSKGTSKATRAPRKASSALKSLPSSSSTQPTSESPSLPDIPAKEEKPADAKPPSASLVTPVASSPVSSPIPIPSHIDSTEPEPVSTQEQTWNMATESKAPAPHTLYANVSPPLTPGPTSDSAGPRSMLYSPTASVPMTMHGLPVLTSHEPIPFAPSNASKAAVNEAKPGAST